MRSSTLDDTFPDEVFQLVKMDVQGAELAAVRGGSRLLANTMFLLLELPWYGQYNEGVASFAEHVAALDAAGFIVYVQSLCVVCLCVYHTHTNPPSPLTAGTTSPRCTSTKG